MIRRLLDLHFHRDHRFTRGHASEYLDGELGTGGARRIERHAALCPQCRRLIATLRRTVAALGSMHAAPRPGIADGVIARLREPS